MSGVQWGCALAALVTAGVLTALGLVTPLGGVFLGTAVAIAVPLLPLRDQPKAFARACLVIGVGLLGWALVGAVIGMFLFVPTALLLIGAAFAEPGNRPGRWWVAVTPVAVAAAVAAFYLQPPDADNEPPPYFLATLDSRGVQQAELERRTPDLRERGATRIEVYERAGRLELTVGMPDHFAPGQSQAQLGEEIRRLPGVVDVQVCNHHTCY